MNIFEMTTHRPYPLPSGPWIMWQVWSRLLFVHWPVPMEPMRKLIPESLTLDTFDGQAWIGIVPFRIEIAPRGLHWTPFKRHFNEINVRTYVSCQGRHPGVWFFSLDASDTLSVMGARVAYKLPYFNAEIDCRAANAETLYHSRRTHPNAPAAEFTGEYQPTGSPFSASKGSFEAWLTERYCLYTTDRHGRPFVGEIHHPPWPLQPAQLDLQTNTMAKAHGILLPETPPHLLYAERQEMVAWPLRRVTDEYLAGFDETP